MSARRDVPVLDRFRLLAAFLAVCNHTAPLAGLAPEADFWLTRVLARIAVPFFLMVSGYFLSRDGWRGTGRFLKRTLTLYAAAVLLYLPLNWYNGGFSPLEWLKKLLELDGGVFVDTPAVVRNLHASVGVRQSLKMGARSHETVHVSAR